MELTSKQRAQLRGMAATMDTILHVGKDGISDNLIKQADDALEARELIKVSVLNNNDDDPKAIAIELERLLGAQIVAVTGKKIVLYRRSSKKDFKHIVF